MKIATISDIHGNLEALETTTETWDELWVLGDLVNCGPNPSYAVWEDDQFLLKSQPYATAETVRKVLALPISAPIANQLADVLTRGASPS